MQVRLLGPVDVVDGDVAQPQPRDPMRHAGEHDIDRSQQSDPHRRETNAEIVARRFPTGARQS
jgi:hypothetical protein